VAVGRPLAALLGRWAFGRQVVIAARTVGEFLLMPRPLRWKPPRLVGSGKFGTPFWRMQRANASRWLTSGASCAALGSVGAGWSFSQLREAAAYAAEVAMAGRTSK
jgi:hypothetical protein